MSARDHRNGKIFQPERNARRYAAVSVVILILTTLAPATHAGEDVAQRDSAVLDDLPDVATPQIGDSTNDAELADLKTLAAQKGMSLDAASDRYAWTDNLSLAVQKIRQEMPEAFSGAAIVDKQSAWVAFAENAPEAALEIISAFQAAHAGVTIKLRSNFGFTEAEIQKAITTVHYAVFDTDGIRDATTSFDYGARQITTVVAFEGAAISLEDLRARAASELANAGLGSLRDEVSLEIVPSDLLTLGGTTSDTEHIGGEDLSGCTSGFTVKHSTTGVNGVATAGHCGNSQSDDGVALTYQAGHEGQYGDFQWHSGPQPKPDDFYAGSATSWEVDRRDVAAIGAPIVGQSLCKNGYAGFKDCGEVIQLNVCHFSLCNLVEMDARTTVGGDSGGPFFWGNTAYGFMYGWRYDPVWPYDRDLFSRADRITQALGVFVKGG